MENIVFYGFDEALIRPIADRYGFTLCRTFDELGSEGGMLVQPQIVDRDGQLDFFGRMVAADDRVGAVIAASCDDTLGLAHYSSEPGKFFTAAVCDDDADTEYELSRIIESRLGLLSAHEGVAAPGRCATQ